MILLILQSNITKRTYCSKPDISNTNANLQITKKILLATALCSLSHHLSNGGQESNCLYDGNPFPMKEWPRGKVA